MISVSKKIQWVVVFFIPLLTLLSLQELDPEVLCRFGLCAPFLRYYVYPLYLSTISIAFISLIASFFNKESFYVWLKFAKWSAPLMIILVALSPYRRDGAGFFPSLQNITSILLPIVFVISSLIVFIYCRFIKENKTMKTIKSDDALITKNVILTVSLSYLVYFILYLILLNICHRRTSFCGLVLSLAEGINFLLLIGLPLLVVLPLSLLTYKMDNRIFETWKKFTLFVIPIISLITLWLGMQSGGGFGGGVIVFLVVSLGVVFFFVSLGIILVKWLLVRKG
jgi:hypothetical protein